ncbi:glyoxalase [Oerskovia sp. M15]
MNSPAGAAPPRAVGRGPRRRGELVGVAARRARLHALPDVGHRAELVAGSTYIVLEASPAVRAEGHDRLRPGVNHLAFSGGRRSEVDDLASRARDHGWTLLFADSHPYAGGPEHYAAYLENEDGFEVEIVASDD